MTVAGGAIDPRRGLRAPGRRGRQRRGRRRGPSPRGRDGRALRPQHHDRPAGRRGRCSRVTRLPLDVHLMIAEPDRYLDAFVDAGARPITVHVEVLPHLHRTLTHIRALGARAGVALNPSTPVARSGRRPRPDLDHVLVMSVNPGFGGQTFIPHSLEKIAAARELLDRGGQSQRPSRSTAASTVANAGGAGRTRAPSILVAGVVDLRHGRSGGGHARPAAGRAERPPERAAARPRSSVTTPARAVRRNRPDGRRLLRQLLRLVRGRAARTCCASSAGRYREMEDDGRAPAGDRSALRVPAAGALRRRARVRTDGRARARRCAWSSTTRSCGPDTAPIAATGRTDARRRRSRRAARAGCRRASARRSHEGAVVTGAAGFIGSHLADALLARGARRSSGIDCFTDYYPRDVKERNLAAARRAPALPLRRGALQTADLRAAARRRDARLPPGGAGRRAQELGHATSQIYTDAQRRRDAAAARGARRAGRSSGSSTRRARRSTATCAAMPMREDALPQPVSPYGVTKLAAEHLCYLYHVNYGVPTVSLRYFTVYGPRQRPDMAFHRFIRAALTGAAHHALRRRRADARLHLRGRRRGGDRRGGRPRTARRRL